MNASHPAIKVPAFRPTVISSTRGNSWYKPKRLIGFKWLLEIPQPETATPLGLRRRDGVFVSSGLRNRGWEQQHWGIEFFAVERTSCFNDTLLLNRLKILLGRALFLDIIKNVYSMEWLDTTWQGITWLDVLDVLAVLDEGIALINLQSRWLKPTSF